jgi:hypothetical protein
MYVRELHIFMLKEMPLDGKVLHTIETPIKERKYLE